MSTIEANTSTWTDLEPTLFDDQIRVRASDPATSRAAAESIRPVLAPECARVLDAVRDLHGTIGSGGATAYEIRSYLLERGVDRDQNVIARRLTDLMGAGHVYTIEGAQRLSTKSNRWLTVWFPEVAS